MAILELFKECKIYGKNHPKFLEYFLECPKGVSIANFNSDNYYTFKYLSKSSLVKSNEKTKISNMNSNEKKEYRKQKYLNCEKNDISLLDIRPSDFEPSKYRMITKFKKETEYIWLKKAQRKIHKTICKCLHSSKVPYLHSTIKNVSYISNSKVHEGNKNVLMIDLKDFFTKIEKQKVKQTFIEFFGLHGDIAELYAKILTSPSDEPPYHNGVYTLGQGLPSSPIVAYLCNARLFENLNEYCEKNNIKMTVYVDDVTFSSDSKISQSVIDKIIGTFICNGLTVNRSKIHLSGFEKKSKITGCYVSNFGTRIKSSKHEEMKILYEEIIDKLPLIDSIEDYFYLMNLFFKFHGNYIHLQQVEFKKEKDNFVIPLQFAKYDRMCKILKEHFLFGKQKKNKKKLYSKNNILKKDKADFNTSFQKIKNSKNEILQKIINNQSKKVAMDNSNLHKYVH